jgi:hypothetical protein
MAPDAKANYTEDAQGVALTLTHRVVDCTKLPMNHRLAGLLGLTLALLAAPAGAQSFWKWRDANGRLQLSDRPPPPEVLDKDILQRPLSAAKTVAAAADSGAAAASAAANAASAPVGDAALEAKKKRLQQDQAAQKQAKDTAEQERRAATRAEYCRRSQNSLKVLESGQRVARPTDQGEREILDDTGRAEEIQRARDLVSANCN